MARPPGPSSVARALNGQFFYGPGPDWSKKFDLRDVTGHVFFNWSKNLTTPSPVFLAPTHALRLSETSRYSVPCYQYQQVPFRKSITRCLRNNFSAIGQMGKIRPEKGKKLLNFSHFRKREKHKSGKNGKNWVRFPDFSPFPRILARKLGPEATIHECRKPIKKP